jgi:hypothetical protein
VSICSAVFIIDIPVTMCLHYYHVDVYDETAKQIDTIDLTRTTGNDVNVIVSICFAVSS